MNSPCWLGEGRELGAVEVNLASHQLQASQQRKNQQRLPNSSTSKTHSLETLVAYART